MSYALLARLLVCLCVCLATVQGVCVHPGPYIKGSNTEPVCAFYNKKTTCSSCFNLTADSIGLTDTLTACNQKSVSRKCQELLTVFYCGNQCNIHVMQVPATGNSTAATQPTLCQNFADNLWTECSDLQMSFTDSGCQKISKQYRNSQDFWRYMGYKVWSPLVPPIRIVNCFGAASQITGLSFVLFSLLAFVLFV